MPEVRWSRKAEAELRTIEPVVRDQLKRNANEILHHIPPVTFPHDEGIAGGIMWHRGIACGTLAQESLAQEDHDGPWNYFLFYTSRHPRPEDPDPDKQFEVLDVCCVADVAGQWRR